MNIALATAYVSMPSMIVQRSEGAWTFEIRCSEMHFGALSGEMEQKEKL